MPRVRKAVKSRARRKKVLKAAKGYRGGRSRMLRTAKETVRRALQYAFRDRRAKKRDFRRLWVARISAASRALGLPYRDLIRGLKKAGIELDRKVMADIAAKDPSTFQEIVRQSKAA